MMRGGSGGRVCSSWARAAICGANSVVGMPWNRPCSQPTSWAWATRSSASLGSSCSSKGSDSRSSSSTSSGASPSSSSLMELWWISFSRALLFSSRGAALTSSSSCLIMLPIRMTLAGCSTISVTGRSWPAFSSRCWPGIAMPSGPTTRSCGGFCASGFLSLMPLVCPITLAAGHRGSFWPEQDLADVLAGRHRPARLCRLLHRQLPVDAGGDPTGADERPYIVPDGRDHRGLLRHRPRPQRRRVQARLLGLKDAQVDFGPAAALAADDHQATAGGQRGQGTSQVARAHDVEDPVGARAPSGIAHRDDE